MKKSILIVIIAFLLITGILVILLKQDKKDPNLIAKVGTRSITVNQFKSEMEKTGNYDKKSLLKKMINREAILSKAFEYGLNKDPDVVFSYENLLIGKYKQRYLKPQIDNTKVTDDDISTYYEANIQRYSRPAHARLAIIYMKTHPTMSEKRMEEIRKKMEEARQKALQPVEKNNQKRRGFGKLSINYSEDQTSRYKGGDIGWIYENKKYRWDKAVIDAGFALQNIDDVSDIISTDKGLYLVKLLNRREPKIVPLEKVKGQIKHKVLLEKRKKEEKDFHNEIETSTKIEIFQDVLDSIPQVQPRKSRKVPAFSK